MATLAARYQDGDHVAVWEELTALGPDAMEPKWRDDAEAVADLTMQRVASNVALLVVRLTLMGYRFGPRYSRNRRRRTIEDLGLRKSMESAGRDMSWVDVGEVEETVMGWPGPRADIDDRIATAEALLGTDLPLALGALIRHVDTVDFAGSFIGWVPSAYDFDDDLDWPEFGVFTDPFNLTAIDAVADHVNPDTGQLDPTHLDDAGRFPLPIANGQELSANRIGEVKTVPLPELLHEASVNPVVHGITHRPGIRLVEYLRVSFEWGGFPGFEFAFGRRPKELDVLRDGLLPI